MKSTILKLNLVAALLFSGAALAADMETEQRATSSPTSEDSSARAEESAPPSASTAPRLQVEDLTPPDTNSTETAAPAEQAVPSEPAEQTAPTEQAAPDEGSAPAAPVQAYQPDPNAPRYDRDTILKERNSKTLDLRYCLGLKDNVAIAKCAGE